ncbi:hypothetical protein O3G_MSEX002129 [Manduca sexta]|nr:hypothetical protein O3G_MSEX002129 [Manduca sexta]
MCYRLLIGVAALCIQLSYAAECDKCPVKVELDSGPVCGRVLLAENSTQYHSFRGIPYAKPPVGNRRFRAPESPDPWTEPLDASVEGPACPQRDIFYGILPMQIRGQSEDCLYANVHVPANVDCSGDGDSGLPVLVFIHGGAFTSGSGNSDMYGPEYLVREGVVIVTFNYRLGVFGFLSLNTEEVPGNAGLRDMIELLKWVQRNIRAFGGNPDNVTLMGQSAGAASVHLLSISKAAKGLFKQVIQLSGTAVPSFFTGSRAYSDNVNKMFFTELGIESTDPAAVYQQLLNTPLNQLIYASEKVQYNTGLCTFVPIIEDEITGVTRVLEDDPINLIGEGRGKDYPTLLSFTTDEAEVFRYLILVFNLVERAQQNPALGLPPRISFGVPAEEAATLAAALQQKYLNGTVTLDALISVLTNSLFNHAAFKFAEWRSLLGGAPLYFHQFSYKSEFSPLKYGLWIDYDGAAHAEDLTYILRVNSALQDYVSFPPKTKDDNMKEWMTNMIINFIRCSNPTCMADDVSPWPPVSKDNIRYQDSVGPAYKLTEMTPEQTDMVQFYDSIDAQIR